MIVDFYEKEPVEGEGGGSEGGKRSKVKRERKNLFSFYLTSIFF